MKNVLKISLREIAEPLKKEEMKLILGGGVYSCCCGSGSHTACYEDIGGENSSEAVYNFVTGYCDDEIYHGMGGCFF
jgi:natural product precursor